MRQFVLKAVIISMLHFAWFITAANAYTFHPFYVSVTEMNYNAKTKSIEISCKLFAEDLENVLKQNNKAAVDLANDKLQSQNNYFIAGINEARFRRPVVPGDTLMLYAEILKDRGSILVVKVECKVDGHIVSEAEIMAKVSPKGPA